eukprot:3489261-Amphidinium_carterae.2
MVSGSPKGSGLKTPQAFSLGHGGMLQLLVPSRRAISDECKLMGPLDAFGVAFIAQPSSITSEGCSSMPAKEQISSCTSATNVSSQPDMLCGEQEEETLSENPI